MEDPLTGYVRVKAICVFRDDRGHILVIDGFDPTNRERFWVPIGGRVEFGETSDRALVREVREELAAEIADLRLLGVLENLFSFGGEAGHEIVFVYDARFLDQSLYRGVIRGVEVDHAFTARWIDPLVPADRRPLYPDGLTGLLR